MSPEIHASAAAGFATAAATYERGRPSFPRALVEALTDELDLRSGRTVLDLGAGTGKLTRLLAPSGARVVAVEPVAEMRAILLDTVPGVEALDATAESLPLGPGDADAAVAAQAFHWFDGPAALGELARVLPPRGPFALVWNVRDETEPWVQQLTDLIEPARAGTPSHRSMRWLDAFTGAPAWDPPSRRTFPYRHVTTREATVDRILSISFVATLPDTERARIADRVRAIVPRGDEVVFPYRTDLWIARRR